MMYLIIKEKNYDSVDNSYDIQDYTDNSEIASEMLQGYDLINQDQSVKFTIVKYDSHFKFKKEVE